MARAENRYVCQSCGAAYPKWAGKCDACGAWNSLVEEAARSSGPPKGLGAAKTIENSGNPYVDQFIHGRAEGPIQMEIRAL